MTNINKIFAHLGFIFFVSILYAEHSFATSSTHENIKKIGVDLYLEQFSKRTIVFLPNLQTKHVQIHKRTLYYHVVDNDFQHITKQAKSQQKQLIDNLVAKLCSDNEIKALLDYRVGMVVTFETNKGIALGGLKVNASTCESERQDP